jgi:hypothetical protein
MDNLLVVLERNVAADHIVQQNPERPYRCWHRLVLTAHDPFRWTVDTSPWKQASQSTLQTTARAVIQRSARAYYAEANERRDV